MLGRKSCIVMHGTLHPHAPKTYSGQWPRQTASESNADSRSIARNETVRESLSTTLSTGRNRSSYLTAANVWAKAFTMGPRRPGFTAAKSSLGV